MLEAERAAAAGCCQEPVAERLLLARTKYSGQVGTRVTARVDEVLDGAGHYEEMDAGDLSRFAGYFRKL